MNHEKCLQMGILGGTFDPIHLGHLILASEVQYKMQLDSVLFVPVGQPPHKDKTRVTDKWLRLELTRLALEQHEKFKLIDMEIRRPGFTFALDTLKELMNLYTNTKFFYIIGADVLFELQGWMNYREVFKLCEFVVAVREGFDISAIRDRITYLSNEGAIVHFLDICRIEISSSDIRKRVASNAPFQYFVPENVFQRIRQQGLYQEEL